ncbi:MAG: hypothetical protein IIC67_01205 [Thaumarchaeota archaeon]|nr:hypothetical protein [Nitrososphaerota archaeon]
MEKKTKTVSVRVSIEIGDLLEDESKSNGVSINTLINQVLIKHTQWGKFEKELGILHMSKQTVKKLFSIIGEDSVKTLAASSCKSMLRDMVLFIKGQVDADNLLETISIWLSANNISFRHIKMQTVDRYIIKHDLGRNYSLYLSTTVDLLFNEIDKKIKEVIIREQDLIFEIER